MSLAIQKRDLGDHLIEKRENCFCLLLVLDAFLLIFSFGFLRTQTSPLHSYLLDCGDEDSEKHPKIFDKYKAILK